MIGNGTLWVTITVTVLSAAFALVHLLSLLEKRRPANQDKPKVEVGMPFYAELAVQKAKSENKVHLDFTVQSIDVVDEILMSAHREYAAGKLHDGKVRAMAFFYGAYVGEVACRTAGANWNKETWSRPMLEVAIQTEQGQYMPAGWCRNRIVNGADASVSVEFGRMTRRRSGESARRQENARSNDGWA
ncbi:MAG: hypothetical protein KDA32_05240 [Phycisphaerales bacterium]|nr:hypothetical protein [Phycisphaerales bacterium]